MVEAKEFDMKVQTLDSVTITGFMIILYNQKRLQAVGYGTGYPWGDSVNYNLPQDSSYLSIEECVELILKLVEP